MSIVKIIHSDVEIDRSLRFVVSHVALCPTVYVGRGVRVLCAMYVWPHAVVSPSEWWPHSLQQQAVSGVRDIYHVGLCVCVCR